MNLELLGAFHQNYPEAPDGHLERIRKDELMKESSCATYAVTLQFNRVGSLLAVGCNDGRIELWDFYTRRIIKFICAHVHPVCSVSWSRNSAKLVSASTDNNITIWDIKNGEAEDTFQFPCPVLKVQFNPRNDAIILVCPLKHAPVLLYTKNYDRTILQNDDNDAVGTVASFDRRGEYIFIGNNHSKVTIYKTSTLEVVHSFRCTQNLNTLIKSIEFARGVDCFLLNCGDKVIRVYNCADVIQRKDPEPDPTLVLRDIVTGNQWRKCCFSGDGEYICAGSMKQHSIYLWERSSGTLVKILHGQKGETLLDVVWHPLRPVIVSLSNSVTKEQVSIWAQTQVQNWSAFAPDFKELDENVEYEERESEFDRENEDKEENNSNENEEDDIIVDVETVEPVAALLSSDEEQEPEDMITLLSTTPDIEIDPPVKQSDDRSGGLSFMESISRKRVQNEMDDDKQAKKKKVISVDLPDAVKDEAHPMFASKKPNSSNRSSQLSGVGPINSGTGSSSKKSGSRGQRERHKIKK